MKACIILITFVTFLSCNNENGKHDVAAKEATSTLDSSKTTTVQWIDSAQNIGVLRMGQVAEIKFRFKNIGDEPLFIVSAEPGCGCTVADYPKEAIGSGKEGVIVAAFDTKKGAVGGFRKSINVRTNTKPGNTYLFFEGDIISEDGKAKPVEPVKNTN